MTTITYRDGIMAADSMAYGGKYCASPGSKAKIRRITKGAMKGAVVGISTNNVGGDALLMNWLNRGGKAGDGDKQPDSFHIMLVTPDRKMFVAHDNLSLSGPIDSPFYAIGSGDDYAIGAMAMGATAERAVEIAIGLDHHSGGPVQVLHIEQATDA